MARVRLHYGFVIPAVFVTLFFHASAVGASEPAPRFTLAAPAVLVEDWPMLVSLSFQTSIGDRLPIIVPTWQLGIAWDDYGGAAVIFDFAGSKGSETIVGLGTVGKPQEGYYVGVGVPGDTKQLRKPRIKLNDGQLFTTVFDLHHLILGSRYRCRQTRRLPASGSWRMRARMPWNGLVSNQVDVRIRPSSAREAAILKQLENGSSKESWFPQVVLTTNPIPPTEGLPPETRRVLDFIRVLRAAVRSGDEGLFELDRTEASDWGCLARFVKIIEYECARETGETGRAEAARSELLVGGTSDTATVLVDENRGTIARLRALARKESTAK